MKMSKPLEGYLDFLGPDDIRIKGTRVGIETVIRAFSDGHSPEMIQQEYPTLTLEQVYAVITYYLQHPSELDEYVRRLDEWADQQRAKQQASDPPEVIRRLRRQFASYETRRAGR
jgi:uncharacterized protein (DUF433 family)